MLDREICIDCESAPATDDYNERCGVCLVLHEADKEPADDPVAWSGGFAENH